MEKYDCDVCLSAGSVNQWGYCEICGEEFEDPQSQVALPSAGWKGPRELTVVGQAKKPGRSLTPVGGRAF